MSETQGNSEIVGIDGVFGSFFMCLALRCEPPFADEQFAFGPPYDLESRQMRYRAEGTPARLRPRLDSASEYASDIQPADVKAATEFGILVHSLLWSGVQVRSDAFASDHFKILEDKLTAAISEVFEDEHFAKSVMSFLPTLLPDRRDKTRLATGVGYQPLGPIVSER